MMRKLYVLALALLLAGSAAVVFAAPPDPGSGCPGAGAPHQGAHPHRQFGSFLNLSKEQKEKMQQIRNSFFADTHDLRYNIREKRVEMRKLFTDPKAADATLLAKQKELQTMVVKLMDRKAQMKIEWRRVLTPEQLAKLDQPHRFGFHGHRRHGHFEG
jgi:Spy/CpxP family protein refolding chaperone